MSYFKEHKEGFILTIIFHGIILIILITTGFFTPLPFPEEKGVLVDFGNSDAGLGLQEPPPRPVPVSKPEPVQQEQVAPPVQSTPPPTPPKSANEELMTQDFEESVAVDQAKKKREEQDRIKKEAENRKQKEIEDLKIEQQKRLAEIQKRKQDSIRKIEEVRQAELQRIADARRTDSIKNAQEQARIDAINSRAKNVFSGAGGQNTSSSSSGQGVSYPQGNQGSTTGTSGAERYGLGGGEGISFNLSGRSAQNLKKPEYPGQVEGVVVVEISVDKYGRVTKANAGVRGSTSLDPGLLKAAQNAALSTRFNEDVNAPAFQSGTITYRFVLN
ncbi:MAG TPA: hypothetical protein VJY41_01195 [Prolixibacteraceae bacterium]|nr:hypothetical protein [Prolixibacteraceae bacterium]